MPDRNISEDIKPKQKLRASSPITGLIPFLHLQNLHNDSVSAILPLSDSRIATASYRSISICSVNFYNKTWKCDVTINEAHDKRVYNLCEFPDNKLLSCSWDTSIKLWKLSSNSLTLLKVFQVHKSYVKKVLILRHNRFASCSNDGTIKLFTTSEPFREITTLTDISGVYCMIQLKQRELLVSSISYGNEGFGFLSFWNLTTYKKEHVTKGIHTSSSNGLIELPNKCLAVSDSPSVFIVDWVKYVVIKQVIEEEYIFNYGSLCLLDKSSFVYAREGYFCQVFFGNFQVGYKTKMIGSFDGRGGLVVMKGEKGTEKHKDRYIIVDNGEGNGISMFRLVMPKA